MKNNKIILSILIIFLLVGCSKGGYDNQITTESITISNNTTAPTTAPNTTIPDAEAVAGIESYSTSKVVWGVGNIVNHQQPSEPKSNQNIYKSLGGHWLLDEQKQVCLTFDEGYENGYTPQILDALKEKNVRAVFFVTYDFARDNPELIKRMIDEGHVLGNHSYHHYSMDEVSDDVAHEEVDFLHKYIKKNYNYTMSYFRFPKGEFSQRALAIVKELGYKSIFWSFAYADWDPNNQEDETKAFTHICESTHPGEILLLHAVSKTNANILPKVIDDIRQQGYSFTTQI